MIVIPVLSPLLAAAGKEVASWSDCGSRLCVQAVSTMESAACPTCGAHSSRRHGLLWRTLADCPSFGHAVTLEVQVQRFKCVNPACARRTFSEPIEPLAGRRQRRTWRLRRQHLLVGYALGGEPGARLTAHLGMCLSGAALLGQMRAAGCTAPESEPQVVGIDDWAMTRSRHYGTIVVDLERRKPLELLAGRDGGTVGMWLAAHPGITIVARDRSGPYSEAVTRSLPAAIQVADRWHLMGNLRDALERLLLRLAPRLREAARLVSEEGVSIPPRPPSNGDTSPPRPTAAQQLSAQRRQVRLARYEEVVRRHAAGESIHAIAQRMGLDRKTVRKFVQAGGFPERAPRPTGRTIIDAHRPYLRLRAAQGMRNATGLWRELRERGFAGGRSTVTAAFAGLRSPSTTAASSSVPSARRACGWLLGWSRQPEREEDARTRDYRLHFVATLCRLDAGIAEARRLARELLGILSKHHDAAMFDHWLARLRACSVPELRRFATGLLVDHDAVRAAVVMPWSSGQVEGQINRLKLLKRQMYGRARLDLLRIRVLHSN
jgi:transposase